jgi:hypothetical protein
VRRISVEFDILILGCLSSLHQILVSRSHITFSHSGRAYSSQRCSARIENQHRQPVFNPLPALFYYFDPRENIQLTPSESLLHTNPQITVCLLLPTRSTCSPRIPRPLRSYFAVGLPCILVRIHRIALSRP